MDQLPFREDPSESIDRHHHDDDDDILSFTIISCVYFHKNECTAQNQKRKSSAMRMINKNKNINVSYTPQTVELSFSEREDNFLDN